jgi:hypothetical protein
MGANYPSFLLVEFIGRVATKPEGNNRSDEVVT